MIGKERIPLETYIHIHIYIYIIKIFLTYSFTSLGIKNQKSLEVVVNVYILYSNPK